MLSDKLMALVDEMMEGYRRCNVEEKIVDRNRAILTDFIETKKQWINEFTANKNDENSGTVVMKTEKIKESLATVVSLANIPRRNNMTIEEKCKLIVLEIVRLCGDETTPSPRVSFTPDWGGNSVTVEIAGRGHSHCGEPDGSAETLIDALHGLICHDRGLSFVPVATIE